MKTFTQKIMLCVAMIALVSTLSNAQTFLVVNAPGDIAGDYVVVPGALGTQGVMTITGDLILGEDGIAGGTAGTETDGCEPLTTDATDKIVVLDRAECGFWQKAQNAEAANAIALLVCNNVIDDPIVMGFGANGEGADVDIPCYMASLADCNTIKMSINDGNIVNVTIEEREEDCPVTYDDIVFWGDLPGQGDFSNGIPADWENINIQPLDRPEVIWESVADGTPIFASFFGSGLIMESPSACNGTASFSAVKHNLGDNPAPTQPYDNYGAELITPSIDCSGKDSIVLEFYSVYNNLNNDANAVSISTDGGMTYIEIGRMVDLTANTTNDVLMTERIRIPVPQMANQPDCKIKFSVAQDFYYWSLDDITLRSGTFKDVRANNFFAVSQNYYGPANQPAQIPFLIDVQNLGNSTVDINVTAEVLKGTDVLHTQSISYPDVAAGALEENRPFPETYTPPAEAGEFTIRYTVGSNIGDDLMDNNIQEATFIQEAGGRVMSKLPLDYGNLGNWGIVGQSDRTYGAYYRFPSPTHANGSMMVLDSIQAGITQDEAAPPITGFLQAEIFTWIDLNDDQVVQVDERTMIGLGEVTVLADGFYGITLVDVNDEDAKVLIDVASGEGILAMIHHNSIEPGVTWRPSAVSTGDPLSTTAADLAFDTLGRLDANIRNAVYFEATGSSPDDIPDREFQRSGQLSYYCPIFLGEFTGVNDIEESITFGVFPNPTADLLNIDLEFEDAVEYAAISILDNTGKFVRGMSFDNVTKRSTSINVSALADGVYHVKIQTPNGYSTKQFIVQK
jgi:hypothetical protein